MKTLEQAAQQALEALEVSTDWDISATGKQAQSMRAITALREALAQREQQEPVAWAFFYADGEISDEFFETEQKGLKWMDTDDCLWDGYIGPVYTTPPSVQREQQERIAILEQDNANCRKAVSDLMDELSKREHQAPVAWHEPGSYGNVTIHKDWALANGWQPLYKERT